MPSELICEVSLKIINLEAHSDGNLLGSYEGGEGCWRGSVANAARVRGSEPVPKVVPVP